jgi:hypothetical protein
MARPDALDVMVVDSLLYAVRVQREGEKRTCLNRKCRKEFVTRNVSQHCCSDQCSDAVYNEE